MREIDETELQPAKSVEIVDGALDAGVLFLCDHASNALPAHYENLGLAAAQFERHIAYDIGAAHVTRRLAAALGAPALLTRFSRLLIDPNRGADDPTLVMRLSDGAIIPGNSRIGRDEIARRLALYWRPYREETAKLLDAMTGSGRIPALISVHSFTPAWRGAQRPWEVGILWDNDPRLPAPFMTALREAGVAVGDNEPYDGALAGDTLDAHANSRGLANMLIELRQDLIGDRLAAEAWAERLAAHLRPVLAQSDVHMIQHHGSRADARPSGEARRI
ncbi:MAG TPA: N-formylglutamate amidohydrolase [Beijerinckiaceae bacterium]|nr:N-formylglutamate amidohydrolase [Beijerinckiaceae bacterium]